jgi:hypothetical protein
VALDCYLAMCKVALVDGDDVDDTKTLSEVLGVPVVLHEGCEWQPDTDKQCLCNCDVHAMAAAAGKACEDVSDDWDNWAFVDWVITSR